jgi:hypothetical protein
MNEKGYTIMICSDVDYEHVYAEICFDEDFIVVVSQEDGPERLKIEFLKQVGNWPGRQVDLDKFLRAVGEAKQRLVGNRDGNKIPNLKPGTE